MQQWIDSLIWAAVGPISRLAKATRDRLTSIYTLFTTALGLVRSSFAHWVSIGGRWAGQCGRNFRSTYYHLRWLALVDLPRRAGVVTHNLYTWAVNFVHASIANLRSEASAWWTWLRHRLDGVASTLNNWVGWVEQRIGEIVGHVARLIAHVFGPLATPERLASWAIGAIMNAAGRWIWARVEFFAVLLWRYRNPVSDEVLRRTESTLERLM